MILTADWHLTEESAEVVFAALDAMITWGEKHLKPEERILTQLGDLYHIRYQVPVALQNALKARLDKYVGMGWFFHLVAGNHDQVDVNGRNALEVLDTSDYADGRVWVHTYPAFWNGKETNKYPILFLPYRRDRGKLLEAIEGDLGKRARFCFGHHGVEGAEMNSGIVAGEADGVPPAWFKRFDHVFMGHWHRHHTVKDTITYVGSPWQTRADEAGQEKGFVHLHHGGWTFVSLRVGPRHYNPLTGFVVDNIQPGDRVKLDAATEHFRDALVAKGASVFVEKEQEAKAIRVVADSGNANLRDYAAQYVADNAPDPADSVDLMRVFEELTA